ncbi:flagellar hook-basal body complex protein [Clostridium intestinale]|nr:flagellar hook-basal body complex protein [Clostridium intestinale]
MKFTFAEGGSLNGYKIQIGKITKGTELSTVVDEKSKTITINGDFTTTPSTIDNTKVQNSIRKSLTDKGITQLVTVANAPKTISEAITATDITGGTPVQSLNADGTISFVDATKDLKSYDGALKSLKIPETVVVPGTDQELKVKSYTIDKTGVISAILEDGSVAALGQIAMASFRNPEGLTSLGKNLYEASANSGGATIKSGLETTGEDNSKGYGDNVQGMLEMSNVDLAEQFTDMIVTNRAFQASGKMITTGDEILQDIINLKR